MFVYLSDNLAALKKLNYWLVSVAKIFATLLQYVSKFF